MGQRVDRPHAASHDTPADFLRRSGISGTRLWPFLLSRWPAISSLSCEDPRAVGEEPLLSAEGGALSGLEMCFGLGYLGLRAARCTPGYHITGLQPLGESATS